MPHGGPRREGSGLPLGARRAPSAQLASASRPSCLARPDPRWTQWIFLQLFNKGLAYQAEVPVNWCPALGTGARPRGRLRLLRAGAAPAPARRRRSASALSYLPQPVPACITSPPCPALPPPCPRPAVLANEEVIDGLSERGGHPVVRMPMKQWMLKITAYGDRWAPAPSCPASSLPICPASSLPVLSCLFPPCLLPPASGLRDVA